MKKDFLLNFGFRAKFKKEGKSLFTNLSIKMSQPLFGELGDKDLI